MKKKYLIASALFLILISCKQNVENPLDYIDSKSDEIPMYTFPDLWQLKRNNQGQEPIQIKDYLTDHIYLKPVDYERNGSLTATFTPEDGEYQWVKKEPGGQWEDVAGETKTTLGIKIPAGESEIQYALRHTWYEFRVYTNICTVKASNRFSNVNVNLICGYPKTRCLNQLVFVGIRLTTLQNCGSLYYYFALYEKVML